MTFSYKSASIIPLVIAVACISTASAHDHTHVGINQDHIAGTADDTQLWIFATGEQVQWDTIELIPTGEFIGDLQIYKAELDCWHTAHPEHGGWQLGGADETQMPQWRIGLERVSFSDGMNFWMEDESTGLEVLTENDATVLFGEPIWMQDVFNEKGTLGAWGFHSHLEFLALASGPGEVFAATFTVFDAGTTGYLESAPYTMTFVTVPEPMTVLLLGAGGLLGLKRRRRHNRSLS